MLCALVARAATRVRGTRHRQVHCSTPRLLRHTLTHTTYHEWADGIWGRWSPFTGWTWSRDPCRQDPLSTMKWESDFGLSGLPSRDCELTKSDVFPPPSSREPTLPTRAWTFCRVASGGLVPAALSRAFCNLLCWSCHFSSPSLQVAVTGSVARYVFPNTTANTIRHAPSVSEPSQLVLPPTRALPYHRTQYSASKLK